MGALKQAQSSYEDARRQRLEENKRRLQELGISGISKTISEAFKSAKKFTAISSAPQKPRAKLHGPPDLLESRRSSRIAKLPTANYKDMEHDLPKLVRRSGGSVRRRCLSRFVSKEAREEAAAMAAKMIGANNNKNPWFVKRMLPSHVSSCFWLGIPLAFCKAHLPETDQCMTLSNEKGGLWESLYLARKTGLSAGWKKFAEDNELSDGDAVLFELIGYDQFKCYIARALRGGGGEEEEEEEEDDDDDDEGKHRKKLKTA